MKNLKLGLIGLFVVIASSAFSLGVSVKMFPNRDTLCYGEQIYLNIPGNSFNPVSYQWNTGATSASITATGAGTYTATVSGYLGNSSILVNMVVLRNYQMLPQPSIQASTPLWVCKLDTVRLETVGSYDTYTWNNGVSGQSYEKIFSSVNQGGQTLDTVSVWYSATYTSRNSSCTVNSDTVLLRGIRSPRALTPSYCGATGLNASEWVKTDLVLTYLHPTGYEVEFTDVNNPGNVYNYFTIPGSRMVHLIGLPIGTTYSVRTRAVINSVAYCWGSTCTIEITSLNRIGEISVDDLFSQKDFQVYDLNGRLVFTRSGTSFDNEWLRGMPTQTYAVLTLQKGNITDKKLIAPTSFGER